MKLSREELIEGLKKFNWVKSHLAKYLGVGEASVRRACIKYDIKTTSEAREEKHTIPAKDYSIYVEDKVVDEPKTVLAFGDFHAPFQHPNYLDFLVDTAKRFKCNYFVCTGDEIDNHALSFHPHDPDGFSANEEFNHAQKYMSLIYKAFPRVDACISNHTSRPYRIAYSNGLPMRFIKSYNEFMGAPSGWEWRERFNINGVVYQHGTGYSGDRGHITAATKNRQSTVIGHIHSSAGTHYMASINDLIFGMNVGCGMDAKAYAFQYGRFMGSRPVLGCGVIIEGKDAMFVPMK